MKVDTDPFVAQANCAKALQILMVYVVLVDNYIEALKVPMVVEGNREGEQ